MVQEGEVSQLRPGHQGKGSSDELKERCSWGQSRCSEALWRQKDLLDCDATAEARRNGGSGEMIVAEKSEKRCKLVVSRSQRLRKANWKAQETESLGGPRPGAEGLSLNE